MSNSAPTAASTPLKLGDNEYLMAPLTDMDISELDEWVQSRVMEVARRALVYATTPTEREEMIRVALKTASSMTWMSGEGSKMMSTVDGLTRLVWQSLKKNHPAVTFLELRKQMIDPINVLMFNTMFRKMNQTFEKRGPQPTQNPEPTVVDQKTTSTES